MRFRSIYVLVLVLIGVFVVAEVAERAFGFTNFPLYICDADDLYRPAPNQSGVFRNKNDWVYNNYGMGVAAPFKPIGWLIVGDSETEGSISFMKQADKIGPLLQKDTGQTVWPMGAKGWGLANELGWINSHPEVFALKRIMILSNSGDFGPAHPWDDQILHPTRKPLLATPYIIQKLFYKGDPLADNPPPTPASTKIWHDALHRFLTQYHGQVVFILLPIQPEVTRRLDGFKPLISQLAVERRQNLYTIRVADDPRWNASLYQNHYHPSAAGDRELAAYVSSRLPPLR